MTFLSLDCTEGPRIIGRVLNPSAVELWNSLLTKDDRILILGGSGWFGRTANAISHFPQNQILSIGSQTRQVQLDGKYIEIFGYSPEVVRAFEPTVVLDFWFLTREKAQIVGPKEYEKICNLLTKQTLEIVQLPSVKHVISTSSGAAINTQKNLDQGELASLYGELKRKAETSLMNAAEKVGINLSLVRVFSVSGCYVTRPLAYAFSNLAIQALSGKVQVTSAQSVRRRYVAVEDLLAVALASSMRRSRVFSTGGELVEIEELANLFCRLATKPCIIHRSKMQENSSPDDYFADDSSWQDAVSDSGLEALSLGSQARNVLEYFRDNRIV